MIHILCYDLEKDLQNLKFPLFISYGLYMHAYHMGHFQIACILGIELFKSIFKYTSTDQKV